MLVNKCDLRRRAGLYTRQDVAEVLGISYWSLYHHIQVGHLCRPAARIRGLPRRYYTTCDVERIAQFFKEGKS